MKHSLSQPVGLPEKTMKELWITFADLLMPVNSAECLHCHESYIVNDPLDICATDLEYGDPIWLIYGYYFDIPGDVYLIWNIGERQLEIARKSFVIVRQWLENLRNDIENEENLYDIFLKNHSFRGIWPFYDEKEFYKVMKPFFQFYIRYWECIEQILVDACATNSNEVFEERYHELNYLLDELKFFRDIEIDVRMSLWTAKIDKILKKWEVLPYTKSFTFRGKTIMMEKNTNISKKRVQEIYALNIMEVIKEHKEKREYETLRTEHFLETGEYLLPDDDIPF